MLAIVCGRASNRIRNKQETVLSDSPVCHGILICVSAVECDCQLGAIGETRHARDECGVRDSDRGVHIGGVDFGEKMFDAGIYGCK